MAGGNLKESYYFFGFIFGDDYSLGVVWLAGGNLKVSCFFGLNGCDSGSDNFDFYN